MEAEQLLSMIRQVVREELGGRTSSAVSFDEACKRLAISKATLGRLVKKGELVTVPIGGVPKVPVSEIERLCTPKRSPAMPEHGQVAVAREVRELAKAKSLKRKSQIRKVVSAEAQAIRALNHR